MAPKPRSDSRQAGQTLRQAILDRLREGPLTARELSGLVRIREKEVLPHLEHLDKSLRHTTERLVIEPAECLNCGFRFEKRRRFSKPSACPVCRCQRIDPPVFRLRSRQDPSP